MKRKALSTLGAAIAMALYGGQSVHAQCTVTAPDINAATPFAAGPVNPNNGFAEFVTDSNGLSLELCLDGDGATGLCFFDPVVGGNLFSEQIGFGAEAFWWLSEATIPEAGAPALASGLDAIIVMAAEAAFLFENPAPGEQFPFTRLRIRIDVPQPGVYTVTHPYGTETFTVEAVGAGQEVRTSQDIEFTAAIPPATSVQGQGCVGPWLAFDPLTDAPAGFIGDGATPHAVTGSPTGNNFFQISAVDLLGNPIDLDGPGSSTVSTDLFVVFGKLYDGQLATPMVVDRSTYERVDNVEGQVDVFATGAQTATVSFNGRGAPGLPAGPIPLVSDEFDPRVPGKFFASEALVDGDGFADATAVPPVVEVNATDLTTDPTRLLRLVEDRVNITRADYNLVDGILTVEAETSDGLAVEGLTLAETGTPLPARITTVAPPARVNVVSAAGGTESVQVAVIDNQPPQAADDAFTVDEDSVGNILAVLADNGNGADSDADGINVASVVITGGPANGTGVANADGTVTYTPNADFNGPDSFTYTVEDNTGIVSNEATVSVTVTPVNDAPVANDDTDSTTVNIAKVIDVLGNDLDVDGDALTVASVTDGANGTVTNNGTDVTYTPNTGFTGQDSFTYTTTDGQAGSNTATVTVDVFNVNNPPVANDDSFTVNEDSGANVLNVLGNDSDPDAGQTLTVTAVTQPAAGTGAVVNNGTSVSYTPPRNFNGTATFSYSVSDGSGGTASATVTVTVAPVNDNPIAVGDFATTTTGTPVVVNVLANDTDVDNVPPAAPNAGLTVTAVTQPANGTASINLGGSSVTYVSNAGFTGVDTFSYTVSDGNGGTATGSVAINVTGGDGGLVDIDIDRLTAGNRVAVGGTVTPNLRVRNNGVINQAVPATLVGVQGGQTVYVQTIQVSDAPGGGATAFNFPAYTVTAGGDITWTATIVDGDVDVDQATATTRVR